MATANLLGALALGITDHIASTFNHVAGVTISTSAAVLSIGTRPGTSIHHLARVLSLTHSATVRIIDRLQQEGLVYRKPGSDGRSVALELSPSGKRMFRQLRVARADVLDVVIEPLTPRERAQLDKLLVKVLTDMPQDREGARTLCRLCDHDECRRATPCPVGSAVENAP